MIPAVMDFLPRRRRTVPPPEPDLLAESGDRAVNAAWATTQLGPNTSVAGKWFELPATLAFGDPKPLDPVVFGPPLARRER